MRIILLGATGYLGSNIAVSLIDSGHEVAAIIRPSSKLEKVHQSVKFIMNDSHEIERELQRTNYDWVINSACVYKEQAAKYHVANFMTMGTSLPDEFNMYSFTKSKLRT